MAPLNAHERGHGEQIAYHVAESTLGSVLLAWTPRGICLVTLGEPDELVADLAVRFPRATRTSTAEGPWIDAVVRMVDGGPAELPLDLRGTAFQERVWQLLRTIPPGETRTYTQLAAALGMPRGARAVASACARNAIAVAIPCHRVLRSDGGLSGYRWGVARKRALLEREGALQPALFADT
jgi:AraC family transcriptional regulator of adaptative response/methylated-DNA-[protein]-cysteine methyltransferase